MAYNNFNNDPNNYYRGYKPNGVDLRGFSDKVGWPLVVISFFVAPWVGIALGIAKVIGKQQKEDAERVRQAMYNQFMGKTTTTARTTTTINTASTRTSVQDSVNRYKTAAAANTAADSKPKAEEASAEKNHDHKMLANVLLGIGLLLIFASLVDIAEPISWLVYLGADRFTIMELLEDLALMATGGAMVGISRFFKNRARMFKKIKAIVGNKDHMAIDAIASALPASYKDTCKNLETCIDKGEFGPSAYLDMGSKYLIVRGEGPKVQQEVKPKEGGDAEVRAKESEYQKILRQLREVNLAIPGEEMTAKINQLEAITAQIFDIVSKEPEKLPQIRKFMDYYLPTAQRLLDQYADYERSGADGEVVRSSKASIEQTMDAIVLGFKKQLDKLFANDALDVSADISVLKDMLAQDGLDNAVSPFQM